MYVRNDDVVVNVFQNYYSPLHTKKNSKNDVTTQNTPPKLSITQRLRTNLGRSFGVTKVIGGLKDMNCWKGIKLDFIWMQMKLIKNKNMCRKSFHERCLYPFYVGGQQELCPFYT